jgi:hypothetical protein
MHKAIGAIALLVPAVSSIFLSVPARAQQVPKELQPPVNEQLLLKVHAKGDQIYVCKSDGAQVVWTLKGPDAQLFDATGKPFGKHFVGPSWESNDGSSVTGKAVANAPSPDADSIPWLLLTVADKVCSRPLHPSSESTRKAVNLQRLRAVMPIMPARKFAQLTPPTMYSSLRSKR